GILKGLIATGCLTERYREVLAEEIPELDAVIGTGDFAKIAQVIDEIRRGEKRPVLYGNIEIPYQEQVKRKIDPNATHAFIKIAEGCDNHCTYCIIPKLRGRYKSRKIEPIVEEARLLAQQGIREIILIAQDTALYGIDQYGEVAFPKLLRELDQIQELKWIRFLYAYPENVSDELIRTVKNAKRIVPYFDMPFQHTEDRILKLMGRKTTKTKLFSLVEKIRSEIPHAVIRTTLISGFPTETDEEHRQMLEAVKALKINKLGVFAYSKEEDTAAANMKGQIDADRKMERQAQVMEVQRLVSQQVLEQYRGEEFEVLIESYENGEYVGRTWMDAPEIDGEVLLETDCECTRGDWVKATITDTTDFDLIAALKMKS
ncbi:MAG TPA: 30S ribosomal protein S12 methylthiotransferase RimO, partial [Eubacteriaceae bacterium]|nr:30S ribosomal protein S12 methylthiotransferase RimO [Eubacteriaceae bacterium]